MDKLLDSLYTKLVLRDVLGKMIPGSMLLVTLYISLLSKPSNPQIANLYEAVQAIGGVPATGWVFVLAAGWLTALALQGLGGWIPKRQYLPYIRYCSAPAPSCCTPDDPDGVKKFYRDVVHFEKFATETQRQLFERFTVLHEASGNFQLALVFATALLFVGFGWQDILRHEYKDLLLYPAMLVAVLGLAIMHRACIDIKMEIFSEVMFQHSSDKSHVERNELGN